MRLIVILKNGKYYVCSDHRTNSTLDPYEHFSLAAGGSVSIPKGNIEAIECYSGSASELEYVFRPRLRALENSDKYEAA